MFKNKKGEEISEVEWHELYIPIPGKVKYIPYNYCKECKEAFYTESHWKYHIELEHLPTKRKHIGDNLVIYYFDNEDKCRKWGHHFVNFDIDRVDWVGIGWYVESYNKNNIFELMSLAKFIEIKNNEIENIKQDLDKLKKVIGKK